MQPTSTNTKFYSDTKWNQWRLHPMGCRCSQDDHFSLTFTSPKKKREQSSLVTWCFTLIASKNVTGRQIVYVFHRFWKDPDSTFVQDRNGFSFGVRLDVMGFFLLDPTIATQDHQQLQPKWRDSLSQLHCHITAYQKSDERWFRPLGVKGGLSIFKERPLMSYLESSWDWWDNNSLHHLGRFWTIFWVFVWCIWNWIVVSVMQFFCVVFCLLMCWTECRHTGVMFNVLEQDDDASAIFHIWYLKMNSEHHQQIIIPHLSGEGC